MWSADTGCRKPHGSSARRRQRGLTLIEVVTSLALLSLLTVIVEYVMTSSRKAEDYLAAAGRAAGRGRELTLKTVGLVEASRVIFQRDAVGLGYLGALDLSRDPLLPGARLPLFDEGKPLGPDETGDPRTGNILFFVREGDPAQCVADAGSGKLRDITLHRFVCLYPTQTARRLVQSGPEARDLVLWRSVLFASCTEIMNIEDEDERRSVVSDLYARFEVSHAWDESAPVDLAFFTTSAGGTVGAAPVPFPSIAEDHDLSGRGRLVYRDVQLAATDPAEPQRRTILSADLPTDWVPDGFELKISGTPTSRQVWIHIVVESPATLNQGVAVFASTVIANSQEF